MTTPASSSSLARGQTTAGASRGISASADLSFLENYKRLRKTFKRDAEPVTFKVRDPDPPEQLQTAKGRKIWQAIVSAARAHNVPPDVILSRSSKHAHKAARKTAVINAYRAFNGKIGIVELGRIFDRRHSTIAVMLAGILVHSRMPIAKTDEEKAARDERRKQSKDIAKADWLQTVKADPARRKKFLKLHAARNRRYRRAKKAFPWQKKVGVDLRVELMRMREKGLSYAKIGAHFNLDPTTVRYHVNSDFRKRYRAYSRERQRNIHRSKQEAANV